MDSVDRSCDGQANRQSHGRRSGGIQSGLEEYARAAARKFVGPDLGSGTRPVTFDAAREESSDSRHQCGWTNRGDGGRDGHSPRCSRRQEFAVLQRLAAYRSGEARSRWPRAVDSGERWQPFDLEHGDQSSPPHRTDRPAFGGARNIGDGRRAVAWKSQTAWIFNGGGTLDFRVDLQDRVRSAMFSPDGRKPITVSEDDTAEIWDVATGQSLSGPLPHNAELQTATVSADGSLMATGYGGNTQLWDLKTGKRIGLPFDTTRDEDENDDSPVVRAIAFSDDGNTVHVLNANAEIRNWPIYAPSDAALMAQVAEAIAGYRVSGDGTLRSIPLDTLEKARAALLPDPALIKDVALKAEFERILFAKPD